MPKWDTLRKTTRDEQVLAYYKEHENYSQAEIGKVFGISHARVSQILRKALGKAKG